MSRWRKARTARVYSGRRVAAVFCCGGAGGDGVELAVVACGGGAVVATLIKGVDGIVGEGDIVRVVVGMFKMSVRVIGLGPVTGLSRVPRPIVTQCHTTNLGEVGSASTSMIIVTSYVMAFFVRVNLPRLVPCYSPATLTLQHGIGWQA